jgi:hypothetical protein
MYSLHHPCVMGTSVYVDELGTVSMKDMCENGQDVRFISPLCWAWWPSIGKLAECLDGNLGVAVRDPAVMSMPESESSCVDRRHNVSQVSTASLLQLYHQVTGKGFDVSVLSGLACFCAFKREISPDYESFKDALLSEHKTLGAWQRRSSNIAIAHQ